MGPISVDVTRDRLEELEQIENALAERISHNPNWQNTSNCGREDAMQRYEASVLVQKYRELAKQIDLANLEKLNVPDTAEFLELVEKIPDSGPAIDMRSLYARHAGSRGLDRFKCDITADLDIDKIFSLAESYGKYLDLAQYHQMFLNLPDAPRLTYKEFVEKIGSFDDIVYIPVQDKREFGQYLAELEKYLEDFYHRTHLLDDPPELETKEVTSALYCAICRKTFASEGVFKAHFNGKKHKRAATSGEAAPSRTGDPAKIAQLCTLLAPQLTATRANIVRLTGMTQQERQIENQLMLDEIDAQDNYYSEDDEARPDLAPAAQGQIPSWLAKINGLHLQFPCEICGGIVYHGPRAFEKHFSESRHLHGLQCLGITNAQVFVGITDISEATELNKKMAKLKRVDVEVEDEDGNVMTARVYQDLKRQGLI